MPKKIGSRYYNRAKEPRTMKTFRLNFYIETGPDTPDDLVMTLYIESPFENYALPVANRMVRALFPGEQASVDVTEITE